MKKPATLALIVGPPRSGTTLIRNVLNEHPNVAITKELHFFDGVLALRTHWQGEKKMKERIVSRVEGRVRNFWGTKGLQKFLQELKTCKTKRDLFYTMAHFTATKETYKVLVEKTPMDALFMREIRSLFPEAVIIHTMRDGRDVAASASKKWGHRGATPLKIAAFWKIFARAYKKDKTNRHIFLTYEDVIANPHKEFSRVFEALGLLYEERYSENIGTNSSFLGRDGKGIQRSSHHKDFLNREERMHIEYFLKDELAFFGYPFEFEEYQVPLKVRLSFIFSTWKHHYVLLLARLGIKWLPIK